MPTYDVNAHVPNAADLVVGNDVRIGGDRVGVVDTIKPVRDDKGRTSAILGLKLDKTVEPLPATRRVIVRPRSALGLKYVEITPGHRRPELQAGRHAAARAGDARARSRSTRSSTRSASRRGSASQQQPARLRQRPRRPRRRPERGDRRASGRCSRDLEPVARNLSSPQTQLGALLPLARPRRRARSRPVAEQQAALFRNLDTTFAALVPWSRAVHPGVRSPSRRRPRTSSIASFPTQRPFLSNSAALFQRAAARRRDAADDALPILADASRLRHQDAARRRLPLNARARRTSSATLDTFVSDPVVPRGDQAPRTRPSPTLKPIARLRHAGADHLQLHDAVVPQHREPPVRGRHERHLAALHHRRHAAGPEQRGRPVERARQRPDDRRTTCTRTRTRTRRRPGQTKECEAGNEDYLVGKTIDRQRARQPGHQVTQGPASKGQR